jgi:serine/threonine protein kinase
MPSPELSLDVDVTVVRVIDESEIRQGKLLGSGSFGYVYQASYADEQVAYKVLKRFKKKDKNFNREIHSLYLFNHRNIVRIKGVASLSAQHYKGIVLELMSGGSVYEAIMGKSGYTLGQLKSIRQIVPGDVALALQYIHHQHVIYHDLKPENVLLCQLVGRFIAKLTDFGLAIRVLNDEPIKSYRGTIRYMAPEILQKKPHTRAVDIFSFGVFANELYEVNEVDIDSQYSADDSLKDVVSNEISEFAEENCPYQHEIPKWCHQDPRERPTIDEIVEYFHPTPKAPAAVSVVQINTTPVKKAKEFSNMLGNHPCKIAGVVLLTVAVIGVVCSPAGPAVLGFLLGLSFIHVMVAAAVFIATALIAHKLDQCVQSISDRANETTHRISSAMFQAPVTMPENQVLDEQVDGAVNGSAYKLA